MTSSSAATKLSNGLSFQPWIARRGQKLRAHDLIQKTSRAVETFRTARGSSGNMVTTDEVFGIMLKEVQRYFIEFFPLTTMQFTEAVDDPADIVGFVTENEEGTDHILVVPESLFLDPQQQQYHLYPSLWQ